MTALGHGRQTGGCNYTTIAAAVLGASAGSTIEVSADTYVEGEITIDKTLQLRSAVTGSEDAVKLRCGGGGLKITAGTFTMDGLFALNNTVSLLNDASWIQHGSLTINIAGNTSGLIRGVQALHNSWDQYGNVSITITASGNTSADVGPGVSGIGNWNQEGDTSIVIVTEVAQYCHGIDIQSLEGEWTQNGKLEISITGAARLAFGVLCSQDATWNLNGDATIVVANYWPGASVAFGAYFEIGSELRVNGSLAVSVPRGFKVYGIWIRDGRLSQEGVISVSLNGSYPYGVMFDTGTGRWDQRGAVTINTNSYAGRTGLGELDRGAGVVLTGNNTWNQLGPFNITTRGQQACGVLVSETGSSTWNEQNSNAVFATRGANASDVCPRPAVKPDFDPATPSLTISPPANDGAPRPDSSQSVQFSIASLSEITPTGNVVKRVSLLEGMGISHRGWMTNSTASSKFNRATTLVFTSRLAINNATVVYTFTSYDAATNISLGFNQTREITPQYLKFSLWLSHWNWTSTSNRLELAMGVEPSFTRSDLVPNTPQEDLTTLTAYSNDPTRASALMRFVTFATASSASSELDVGSRVNCTIGTRVLTSSVSQVTMTFDHFGDATSLDYDPDLGLLLGAAKGDDSGDDNDALIIGVAVAIPMAVVLVLVVIAAVLMVGWIRRRRLMEGRAKAVNFDHSSDDDTKPGML